MIDHGSRARPPGGTGFDLEQFGGVVAREFEGVAALDKREPLGDEAFELDGFDLGAVLLVLALALGLFVDVEITFDALDLAVEEVDERPQEIGEIVLEAGAGQHHGEALDGSADVAADGVGLGQRSGIGLVPPGKEPAREGISRGNASAKGLSGNKRAI